MKTSLFLISTGFMLLCGCQSSTVTDIETHKSVNKTKKSTEYNIPKSLVRRQYKESGDVWERIRFSMDMPIPDQYLVNRYRQWYIDNPQHLERISQRARPFLYLIVQEFEHRDLPIELALLPIVESSFNPLAYSSADASGLWQFTSPMAIHFGLDMNWWYDGRKDVPAATTAALDMLEYLYKKTDNWLYALAAYNAGEGRLREAIKYNEARGLDTDFWSLKLPTETRQYVPQLLAIADVVKNAKSYGISLNPIPNKPLVEVIDVGSQIDLAVAAKLAKIPVTRLQKLNPGFNRWATSPQGPHQLVVPVSKAHKFKQALANTDVNERVKWYKYQIQNGDNITVIAQRHQTNVDKIKAMNDIDGDKIIAGQFLYMPHTASQVILDVELAASQSAAKKIIHKQSDNTLVQPQLITAASSATPQAGHTVQYGDTLWSIARVYKVSVEQIISWNNMTDRDKLTVGKTLKFYQNVQNKSQQMRL
ncbi:LysM peptidoglycan-binding domain-containing protein [Shewanella ulleungensis]|uniref:Lytic transglycosylase n=1 Tax=Shewanella ulleungensis TaxID=2282699 RepID=A0ABQ2QCF0_9GAMM|nr:LysM peptidoglycan-binding domain-containing protein [Shewanella ulleungensis]MCL1148906.1 LysM peptidoglycan-binding domain-containing protein [Shewanella ulleungensis]GGP74864.1 lytic transglycosylase [Shewanella ulleungensis]